MLSRVIGPALTSPRTLCPDRRRAPRPAPHPERAYLVAEENDRLTGIALRLAVAPGKARGFTSTSLCSFCHTAHTGGGVITSLTA
ncbi:FBP domain-containing protein [Actinomadura nitritigenes]|uniref:FBP domain-containing protein n=1 Tax=Actinomadura nitritigenes TaxID=134602 RepID=UPI003D8A6EAE